MMAATPKAKDLFSPDDPEIIREAGELGITPNELVRRKRISYSRKHMPIKLGDPELKREAKELGITPKQLKARKKKEEERKNRKETVRMANYKKWLAGRRKAIAFKKLREKKEKEKEREKLRKKREREREKKKHKRKIGRPKKRGPKRKRRAPKKKVLKGPATWNYKIVSCFNGTQDGYVGQYNTLLSAYMAFNELRDNNEVVFPQTTNATYVKGEAVHEYLLLERNVDGMRESIDGRDEYGRVVKQETTNSEWVIHDKFRYDIEERFWVWGLPPRDRKTFRWIYENVIIKGLESKYDFKRVILLKNKVCIKDDNGHYEIIMCKTVEDSVRFYNLLREWGKKNGDTNLRFMGSYSDVSEKRKRVEEEIMAQTGWKKNRFLQSTSKNFLKKSPKGTKLDTKENSDDFV